MSRADDLFSALLTREVQELDHLIAVRECESYHIDFKRAPHKWPGDRNGAENELRRDLGKDVSGFANSNGGVLIWGVECDKKKGDVASAKCPLEAFSEFRALIEGMISGVTNPAIPGTQTACFPDPSTPGKGYVAVLVPMSDFRPHQSLADHRYYHRSGSSTRPAEHDFVASLFGRFPQPRLNICVPSCTAKPCEDMDPRRRPFRLVLTLEIFNAGLGVARDYFLQIDDWTGPGTSQVRFASEPARWIHSSTDRFECLTCLAGDRLVPRNRTATELIIEFSPPFDAPFEIPLYAGCEGAPMSFLNLKSSRGSLDRLFQKLANYHYVDHGDWTPPVPDFASAVFNAFGLEGTPGSLELKQS